jgi:hypothetical protein
MPAAHAATSLKYFKHLVMTHLPRAQSAKVKSEKFIQQSALSLKVVDSIKLIRPERVHRL